ncbi:MAG: hypothetical protein HMLKMBBP_02311 [Planctomycetes bacterium]|nr:hypothetical protein [Planctomycetota bacterium]
MIARALVTFAASVLALAAGACASDTGGGGTAAAAGPNDQPGDVIEFGGQQIARIVSVDRGTARSDGKVRYVVENISGRDQEDLVYSVTYAFPPGAMGGDIAMQYELDTTVERGFALFSNDRSKALDSVMPDASRAGALLGTKLNLAIEPPALTMSRTASGPGTRFVGNRLECVGQAPFEDDPSELWLEFENVSNQKLSNLEVQILFVDTKARTKWKSMPTVNPGERKRIAPDIRGLDTGDRRFLVKVRQAAL